jgi:acetyltransferase-like isoleucine patch superfamily enzyme
MNKIRHLLLILKYVNIKTIYFNFHYFKISEAILFPVFISKNIRLNKLDGKVILQCPIRTGLIRIGFGDVGIFDKKKSKGILQIKGQFILNGETFIGHGSKIIIGKEGILSLGKRFRISSESSIIAEHNILIGDDCLFAWEIIVMDTDYHQIINLTGERLNPDKPVIIGNHVWIASRCTILKGSQISDNTIIASNSLVSGHLKEANAIYGGNPAQKIRDSVNWCY